MNEPRWVPLRTVLVVHEMHLARFGGASGIRDRALLESALARPQQVFHYGAERSLPRLATAYAYGIARNHPFVDGNKRTAFLTAALFLETNGCRIEAPEPEVVTAMMLTASGEWDEERLAGWMVRVGSTI